MGSLLQPGEILHISLCEAALRYAELGWRVIPVKGKRPAIKDWPKKASTCPDTIESWFGARSKLKGITGIGIVTGKGSNIVVLDIDPRNGGDQSLVRLQQELGKLPETVTANTGGGGLHLIFKWFPGSKSQKPAQGIDFQYESGSMIVAAPSIHPATGKPYRWHLPPDTIHVAELPKSWRNYLSTAHERNASTKLTKLDQAELLCGTIPEGRRNNTLYELGLLLHKQQQSMQVIISALNEANLSRCSPPLPNDEVQLILDSLHKLSERGKSLKTLWQEGITGDKTLKDGVTRTAIALSLFADANGKNCFPGQERIAARSGKTVNTTREHLETLEHSGWIKRYKRPCEGQGFSYGYILTLKETQN